MRLFLYGTLLDPSVLAEFLGRDPQGDLVPAILHGWRRVVLSGASYPTLRRARDRVIGAVIRVDARALARLCAYEGRLYRLTPVAVGMPRGKIVAHAWIAPGGTTRHWTPPRRH